MEGFIQLKLKPVIRRLLTRSIAIVPAMLAIYIGGEAATGRLLVLSQVILSLTLPFAVVPLVWFTASNRVMGDFAASRVTTAIAAAITAVLMLLNAKLVFDAVMG
jgi:manganese transport protein